MALRAGGFVTLVGAGPGDPGLMTLAGREAIESAEVVLFDRLAGEEILSMIPDRALRIDVGKNKGNHPVPQHEINQLLLEHARAGKMVVRLKGGDPFVFGRGAEELELLLENGIPFRVIPGVSSALAAPAYAGIPATHRDFASSLHILAGHGKDGQTPNIPYGELVKLQGTLVFLMSLSTVDSICSGLTKAGMSPQVPAAVIERGTTPEQRSLVSTVAELPKQIRDNGFTSPAVIVVGDVCALAERFAWTRYLPLWGKAILTVSSTTVGSKLASRLRSAGCRVDAFAGIRMEPLPQSDCFWNTVASYQWIVLTSTYGAEVFFSEMASRRLDLRRLANVKFAAVGSQTEAVLTNRGIFAEFVPDSYNSECLAHGLVERTTPGDTILLFRARDGSRDLPEILSQNSRRYDDIPAYVTLSQETGADALRDNVLSNRYAAVTFTSASTVNAFAAIMGGADVSLVTGYCIGERTAAAARALGMKVRVSESATIDNLVDLILRDMRSNDGNTTPSATA